MTNLDCGSIPAELFESCRTGYSVYMTRCKHCDLMLVSIRSDVERIDDGYKVHAFFRCRCGAKLKKLAVVLAPGGEGYKCHQGVLSPLYRKGRTKVKTPFEPDGYAVDFTINGSSRHRYIVTQNKITYKHIGG